MNSRGGGRVGPEIQLDDSNPTEKGTTSGPEPGRARRDANGDREGWMHKYLFLFYRTWTGLFLASVVCSALAQPHVLDGRERTPSQHVQLFPGQQTLPFEGRPSNVSSAGIACRLHSTPRKSEIRHSEHVDSSPGHSRRTKLRSRRYSRRGDNASNFRPDDDGALATRASPKVSQSGGRSLSRGRTRADVEPSRRRGPQAGDPRDAVILGRLFEHGPKTQRRATHFRQQRDRDVQSDGPSSPPQEDDDEDVGKPCVYSGHLKTDRNWYGYLANVSLAGGSGRLVFEFSYPADACCQSVLFYHEDQLSIMSARTNCWQKEDLLRPDADQILRLTPNFSWSGCQVKKKRPMGDTMVCKGGRSFTRHSYDFHSTASKDRPDADVGYGQRRRGASGHDTASNAAVWYVAVSHCASLKGLDLRYKLKVYGHSVPCPSGHAGDSDVDREGRGSVKSGKETPSESVRKDVDDSGDSKNAPSSSHSSSSTSYQSHKPSDAAQTHLASDEWPVCTIEGSVNTTHSWFGFIKNLSLVDGGGFRFYFSLPYSMSPMNVLLYHDEDIRKLHWEQICWLKDSVIESKHVLERIIDLTSRSIYNGCASKTGANIEGNNLTCRGEKIFSGDRNIYIALSNCRSREGLLLRYKLEVFGYKDQTLCSGGVGILLRAEAFFTFCGSFFLLKLAPFR